MSDHKPECPMLDEQWPKHPLEVCGYCDMISAAEKRVLDAAREAVAALPFDPLNRDQGPAATQRQAIAAIDALKERFSRDQFDAGYASGLDAAREAVAVLLPADYEMNWCAAIDAIDALREKP